MRRVWFAGGGTGGHLYPGLAIARALQARDRTIDVAFIGAQRGIERTVLPTTSFSHELLDIHPVYRARPWENWRTARGLVTSFRALRRRARSAPPDLVVGTGGYASSAALLFARLTGVPWALQEQNAFPGKTTRTFASAAREIWVGFPEAAATLPVAARGRCIDTGNPIEPPPARRASRADALRHWGIPPETQHVVLVFGGSQGAAAINAVVAEMIRRGMPEGVHLIWGTGRDHFAAYRDCAGPHVTVREYLSPISEAYAVADIAVTRAGAMTTAELCAWEIPALLIPLPTAAADHQTANAKALAEAGAAIWLPQSEVSADRLGGTLATLLGDEARRTAMANGARRRARPDAAARIAERIVALLARS